MEGFLDHIDKGQFFGNKQKKDNDLYSSKRIILIKQFFISEVKCYVSLKLDNIEMFFQKSSFLKILKPLIKELGYKILNMDSITFDMFPFKMKNVVSTREDLTSELWDFYYHQIISEIVKSLGGLSTMGSIQILEDINNKVLTNLQKQTYMQEHEPDKIEFSEIVIIIINITYNNLYITYNNY